MVKRRNGRQEAIKWIVRNKSIKTQRALVDELRNAGYTCTQATASRDIADMGLRKLPEGVYVLAEDLHLQRMISEFVVGVEAINNLTVVKAQSGTAPGIGAAVDAAGIVDVVGSVAGIDTVHIISKDDEGAKNVVALVEKLRTVEKRKKRKPQADGEGEDGEGLQDDGLVSEDELEEAVPDESDIEDDGIAADDGGIATDVTPEEE